MFFEYTGINKSFFLVISDLQYVCRLFLTLACHSVSKPCQNFKSEKLLKRPIGSQNEIYLKDSLIISRHKIF